MNGMFWYLILDDWNQDNCLTNAISVGYFFFYSLSQSLSPFIISILLWIYDLVLLLVTIDCLSLLYNYFFCFFFLNKIFLLITSGIFNIVKYLHSNLTKTNSRYSFCLLNNWNSHLSRKKKTIWGSSLFAIKYLSWQIVLRHPHPDFFFDVIHPPTKTLIKNKIIIKNK